MAAAAAAPAQVEQSFGPAATTTTFFSSSEPQTSPSACDNSSLSLSSSSSSFSRPRPSLYRHSSASPTGQAPSGPSLASDAPCCTLSPLPALHHTSAAPGSSLSHRPSSHSASPSFLPSSTSTLGSVSRRRPGFRKTFFSRSSPQSSSVAHLQSTSTSKSPGTEFSKKSRLDEPKKNRNKPHNENPTSKSAPQKLTKITSAPPPLHTTPRSSYDPGVTSRPPTETAAGKDCSTKPSPSSSGWATPTLQFTEDIDVFNKRLSTALLSELAQISFRDDNDPLFDDMGLVRSFTRRLGHSDSSDTKSTPVQISQPMGLISTTNQWVHEVPNIADLHVKEIQRRQVSSTSSNDGFDSDASPTSEPPSMTDTSSIESSSPLEPNHLTSYFTSSSPTPAPRKLDSPSITAARAAVMAAAAEVEALPATEPPKSPTPSRNAFKKPVIEQIEPAEKHPMAAAAETEALPVIAPLQSPTPSRNAFKKPTIEQTEPAENNLLDVPAIPRRALSHSKREHERVARVKSLRSSTGSMARMSSYNEDEHPALRSDRTSQIEEEPVSFGLFKPAACVKTSPKPAEPDSKGFSPFSDQLRSPFCDELRQLDEVAEDYRPHSNVWQEEDMEDRRVMEEQGLKKYRVSEYLREIASFREGLWALLEEEEEEEQARLAPWI